MSIEMAKSQVFDGTPEKVSDFIIVCKLYIRMKMRGAAIEKQIQWILPYIQGGLVNI